MHNIRVFLFIEEKMEHERFLTPTHTPPKHPVNHEHVGDLYTFFSFFRCFQIEMLCRNFYQGGSQSQRYEGRSLDFEQKLWWYKL